MIEPRIPNLFIVGAPKCGTTALSHYLAAHPDVFMSEQAGNKEPEYYASDFRFGWTEVTTRADYLSLYADAPSNVKYIGEASVSYLHSNVAVGGILSDSPSAMFIAMIRNPIEIAQRLHNQRVKHANENVFDFEKAWRLQGTRLNDGKFLGRFSDGRVFQYGELAKIGHQLSRLFRSVPKEQIHVVVYDDLLADPAREYERVRNFLGLKDDGRTEFPVVNPSAHYRIPLIQQILILGRGIREYLRLPGGWGIYKAINRLNAKAGTAKLRPDFRRELEDHFREDVRILSELLDRDFSCWFEKN